LPRAAVRAHTWMRLSFNHADFGKPIENTKKSTLRQPSASLDSAQPVRLPQASVNLAKNRRSI
jgi:hypothetical protein